MSRPVRVHSYRQISRRVDLDIRHTYYGFLADSRRYVYSGCNNTIDCNCRTGGHRRSGQQTQQHHQR